MLPIPAIDMIEGKCVRLRQGDYAQKTEFSDDPVAVACQWTQQGARRIHLVDLDGAKEGRPVNTEIIRRIVKETRVPCQLGGGLRDERAIEQALELGVDRAIIGTRAVRDPDWFEKVAEQFAGQIVLGLDAKNGKVATEGWQEVSEISVLKLAERFEPLPLAAIVYTDIAKDGMMQGPNIDATVELARATRHQVIASGGISTEEDVLELLRRGIGACIIGRSLYEGTVSLPNLLKRIEHG